MTRVIASSRFTSGPPQQASMLYLDIALHSLYTLVYHDILPRLPGLGVIAVIVPLFLQAWLLVIQQTTSTRLLRKALVPAGLYCSVLVLNNDFIPRDAFRAFNFIKNVAFSVGVAKTIEFGFARSRYDWTGYEKAYSGKQNSKTGGDRKTGSESVPLPFSLRAIQDALSLITSHRGHGWSWGIKGDLIPSPLAGESFLTRALLRHTVSWFLLISSISLLQYSNFPLKNDVFLRGLGVPNFPGIQQISDLTVAIVFGAAVWNFLELGYMEVVIAAYLLTPIARKLLPDKIRPPRFDTRMWPPLLQTPLVSTSLADWWTYRWHSILRREFVVMGYKPARYLTQWLGKDVSSLFGVLGAFVASGVLHEAAIYFATSEVPLDYRLLSLRFFVMQGLGLAAEQIFTKVTGKTVSGWLGRIWLLLVLGFPGADLTRAWLGRGLIIYQPTPDSWEWWRWAIPLLMYLPRLR